MGEAKMGQEFVRHELDEAIAIQRCIVQAEERLSSEHPDDSAKRLIKQGLREDERLLKELERLGGKMGATGEVEEVAGGLEQLMTTTLETAGSADSEAYEAQAVLLTLKRKQQDSAGSMLKMAREMKDTELRDAASEFQKAMKESANALADELSTLAVKIATQDGSQPAQA